MIPDLARWVVSQTLERSARSRNCMCRVSDYSTGAWTNKGIGESESGEACSHQFKLCPKQVVVGFLSVSIHKVVACIED